MSYHPGPLEFCHGVHRFDLEKDPSLGTYAQHWIEKELQREVGREEPKKCGVFGWRARVLLRLKAEHGRHGAWEF